MVLCEIGNSGIQRTEQVANPISRFTLPIEAEKSPKGDTNDLSALALEPHGGGFQSAAQVVGESNYFRVLRFCLVPALFELTLGIGILLLSPFLDKIF